MRAICAYASAIADCIASRAPMANTPNKQALHADKTVGVFAEGARMCTGSWAMCAAMSAGHARMYPLGADCKRLPTEPVLVVVVVVVVVVEEEEDDGDDDEDEDGGARAFGDDADPPEAKCALRCIMESEGGNP